ncbi:MAG: hypothetical protein O2779_00890 [Nanoarchaeota archaeon]|nr:hypothetical protein [Nanoarchaeota archaeon]
MVLALDFDGVICNSLHDGLVTAKNTYLRFYPKSSLANRDISDEFVKLRCFVENARDFFVVLRSLEEGIAINTQKEFEEYQKGFGKPLLQSYYEYFYDDRDLLQQDIKAWCAMSPPYEHFLSVLKEMDLSKVFIVTSKDFKSVRILLDHYGVALPSHHIFDNRIRSKLKKLGMLGVPLEEVAFVEDLFANILPIKKGSPVKCFLATWGFNNSEQQKVASEEGITLLTQENFSEEIRGFC